METFIWVWPLLSLPVMAVFFGIYAATRSQGVSLWRSAAKCGATFTAVMTAVVGAVLQDRGAQGWLLVLALALCCAADFAIERSFIAGVVGFALAHAAFIAYILLAAHPVWASLPRCSRRRASCLPGSFARSAARGRRCFSTRPCLRR